MGYDTFIEWCHHTFNGIIGCSKVSAGCKFCYAEIDTPARVSRSQGLELWGPNANRRVASEAGWRSPLAWDRKAKASGERRRVFAYSQGDVFEDFNGPLVDHLGRRMRLATDGSWQTEAVADTDERRGWRLLTIDDARARLFSLIRATPNLDWLLLTKRPERIVTCLPYDWGDGYFNCWLGTSVENQACADERIPRLLAAPASVRFLSVEPLLGPISLRKWMPPDRAAYQCQRCGGFHNSYGACMHCDAPEEYLSGSHIGNGNPHGQPINWVICGGESGPHARPMHPDWARGIRDLCAAAGVPFHFKQHGEWLNIHQCYSYAQRIDAGTVPVGEWHADDGFVPGCICGAGHGTVVRVGKKEAGRTLDGRTWDEFPIAHRIVVSS